MDAGTGNLLGAVVGGMFGMGQGAINTNQNKKAQQRAFGMQKELNQQGAQLAYDMWNKTNYEAQVKHMEKAGLNKALMFGGAGSGGTTSAGSGGSAPQQAPSDYNVSGMALQGAQVASQLQLTEAQRKNIEADTANKLADATNKGADTTLKELQATYDTLRNDIQHKTIDEVINTIKAGYTKAEGEAQSAQAKGSVDYTSKEADIKARKNLAVQSGLDLLATKLNMNLTKAQTAKIAEEIRIGKFNAETARNVIGVDKVAGTALQTFINGIYEMIGFDKDRIDQKVDDGKK